jgi:hypothetical protein
LAGQASQNGESFLRSGVEALFRVFEQYGCDESSGAFLFILGEFGRKASHFFLNKKTCASVLQYHQALDCFVFGIGEQRLIAHHLPDSIMELFALTGC